MPIYEYACGACGHQFEEWQKMSDPPVRTCPKCKKKKVEKLISHTSFALKGGGWYSDLYSNKPAAKAASGDSGADSSASSSPAKDAPAKDSKQDSKKDSKPADAKPAAKPSTKAKAGAT